MTSTSAAWSDDSDAFVQKAVADLAARLERPASAIEIESVIETDWRDSSLGLPEPGRMYAQVITPGLRITLSAGDSIYRYHVGHNLVLRAGAD